MLAPASEIVRGIAAVVAVLRGDEKAVLTVDDAPMPCGGPSPARSSPIRSSFCCC